MLRLPPPIITLRRTTRTAAHNAASIRVLEKNGFVITTRRMTPETARTVARQTVTLVLR